MPTRFIYVKTEIGNIGVSWMHKKLLGLTDVLMNAMTTAFVGARVWAENAGQQSE